MAVKVAKHFSVIHNYKVSNIALISRGTLNWQLIWVKKKPSFLHGQYVLLRSDIPVCSWAPLACVVQQKKKEVINEQLKLILVHDIE